ncbi:hypothetical protein O6H91_18G053400 [Diphasiastrum complanatum]|uniref:Uncharacterized protein n=1 Tax=Diphasiastrum complanatum TaxID=34168 RepID=A0ACC2B1E2_DIPCM|nr:hypothetical protein O6H91_18G053400 [Diphasiastrum complanatum]
MQRFPGQKNCLHILGELSDVRSAINGCFVFMVCHLLLVQRLTLFPDFCSCKTVSVSQSCIPVLLGLLVALLRFRDLWWLFDCVGVVPGFLSNPTFHAVSG